MIYGFIAAIGIILGLIFIIYGNADLNPIPIFIGLAMFILSITIISGPCLTEMNKQVQNEINVMVDNGAKVYLDGVLVDIETVDISYYHITIKDDCILLTKRR